MRKVRALAIMAPMAMAAFSSYAQNPSALIRHLHDCLREVRMTEAEFHEAVRYVNAIGQTTTPSHNEAMLLAGALGVSNLVCLLNNGERGTRETHANTLGPFWRGEAPWVPNGGPIVRPTTPGPRPHLPGSGRHPARQAGRRA